MFDRICLSSKGNKKTKLYDSLINTLTKFQYNIIDYRPTPPTNPSAYSRPPLSASKRSVLYRAASIEQNDRFDTKPDRSIRSSSLQRPSSYLPAFDHI